MKPDQRALITECAKLESLTSWEREFLSGLENSDDSYSLSQKQAAALDRIAKKLKGAA